MTADPSQFTPLQLQLNAAFQIAYNGSVRWLKENVASVRELGTQHATGMVKWAGHAEYREPLRFQDADELQVRIDARARNRGTQLEFRAEIGDGERPAIEMLGYWIPLRLSGDAALSGTPAPLRPDVLAMWQSDELLPEAYKSPVSELRAAIERDGHAIGTGRSTFTLHRHSCEVADQWFWAEIARLAGAGREALIREQASDSELLRDGLRTPLQSCDAVFKRPYYLFDEGEITTIAFDVNGSLAFVHELGSAIPGGAVHAVVVERFA